MSLIKCPNCGREISDKATTCPHCGKQLNKKQPSGRPVQQISKPQTSVSPSYGYTPNGISSPQKPNLGNEDQGNNNTWYWLISIFILIVGGCIGYGVYKNHKTRLNMEATRRADSIRTADSLRAVQIEATRQAEEEKETYNGHDHVDLGLSVDWATCNVDATSPEESGGHYGWADPTGADNTSEVTDESQANGEPYDSGPWISSSYGGPNPPSDICGTELDIAHAQWVGFWRLPSSKEMNELQNACQWKWTTLNGKRGYQVTGPNGNSIFLPAAGSSDVYLGFPGEGYYWTGTLQDNNTRCYGANFLCFYSKDHTGIPTDGVIFRSCHFSVRPVCPKK